MFAAVRAGGEKSRDMLGGKDKSEETEARGME